MSVYSKGRHTKKNGAFWFCFFFCLIVSWFVIPCLFCFLFRDNGGKDSVAEWLNIKSTLSVSEWFSFWIAFLSVNVTAVLGAITYRLTKTIEIAHSEEKAAENKYLFEIKKAYIESRSKDKYALVINLSSPLALDELRIVKAKISVAHNIFDLDFSEQQCIKGSKIELEIPATIKEINRWKNYVRNMTGDYKVASLVILYSYQMKVVDHYNIWYVKSVCRAVVWDNSDIEGSNIILSDAYLLTSQNEESLSELF